MKKLHFHYHMRISYAEPVTKCSFTIKCIPQDTARQQIKDIQIELEPKTAYCTGMDGLGNKKIYGLNAEPHDRFCFSVSGEAQTGLADYETEDDPDISGVFKYPYGLNRAGEKIRSYYERRFEDQDADATYNRAFRMMKALYQDFTYQPGATNVNTSAEEAFAKGQGVCQDYAHIFIALLHLAGIPARYVTGLIIGEGASHAWVEILIDGKWIGLDPTNGQAAGDDYIRIGIGRDARDCMINRGIMHGGGNQCQEIRVEVTEIK